MILISKKMLEYPLSGKNLLSLLTRARDACTRMGEITLATLPPSQSTLALYFAHIRYPPDPGLFKDDLDYSPAYQPHPFSILFEFYQPREGNTNLRVKFLLGHERKPDGTLEELLTPGLQDRNGYSPYLKFISARLIASWQQQDSTPSISLENRKEEK